VFSSKPVQIINVFPEWDFPTFLVHIVRNSREVQGLNRLWHHPVDPEGDFMVNRGDMRIFIVPHNLSFMTRFALAMLCDTGVFSDDVLSLSLPEVVWGGCAAATPLKMILPPPNCCDLAIVVGR
jgi:hypothetical protein